MRVSRNPRGRLLNVGSRCFRGCAGGCKGVCGKRPEFGAKAQRREEMGKCADILRSREFPRARKPLRRFPTSRE